MQSRPPGASMSWSHCPRGCPLMIWLSLLQVLDVQFSITGDSFLAATGSTQVKLYDRDGAEKWVVPCTGQALP